MGQGRRKGFGTRDLCRAAAQRLPGMTAEQVREILYEVLSEVANRVAADELVSVQGFGSFEALASTWREDGVEQRRVKFRPSRMLKQTLNNKP